MMNDPDLELIRTAVGDLSNYCFGIPVQGKGSDISQNIKKNHASFSIDIDAKRLNPGSHHQRSASEFLKILRDAGAEDVSVGVCDTLSAILFKVPYAPGSAVNFNKALDKVVTDDFVNGLSNDLERRRQAAICYLGPVRGDIAERRGVKRTMNSKGIYVYL